MAQLRKRECNRRVQSLRVLTYNVHGFVGMDGRYDPERVLRVLAESGADVLALQEVETARVDGPGSASAQWLAQRLGMKCHFRATRPGLHGPFGNAVLTRRRFEVVAEGFLPSVRDEPRAVQWLRLEREVDGVDFELLNTHLSVRWGDRRGQLQALVGAEWLLARTHLPLVVCGDLNSPPWSGAYRLLSRDFEDVQRLAAGRPRATWPARFPLLRVDHVFVAGGIAVESARVLDQGAARWASDHLPLVADLLLPLAEVAA